MRRIVLRRLVSVFSIALVGAGGALVVPTPAAAAPDEIEVCCAWGEGIKDGIVYSIKAPTPELYDAMRDAVEEWEPETGIDLVEAVDVSRKAIEVTIGYKKGGGSVAGQTIRKFEPHSAFMKGATIQISGGAFGHGPFGTTYDAQTIAKIALHEFGHVLGAGHADTAGFVMSPAVDDMNDTITACDLAAVEAAQAWWFADANGTPQDPLVSTVSC